MKDKGIKIQIEEQLLNGVSREILNTKYNKGTVTRVYNKLNNEGLLSKKEELVIKKDEENIEKQVLDLLKSIVKIVNNTGEYVINISVSKKNESKTNYKLDILNPFEIYGSMEKEEMIKYLINYDEKYLKAILKKHFTYDKKELDKITSLEELIGNIIFNVERTIKIGDSFRKK